MIWDLIDPIRSEWERHDPSFAAVDGDAWVERLFRGGRWLEGPTYFPAGRFLVFSDIPNDRVLRWNEVSGAVELFRSPAGHANGHTRDHLGRLVTCEQSGRRLVRLEHDGRLSVLAETHRGRRFNSPNDVVEHSDGALWFTDPSYGIDSDYEGVRAPAEVDGCHVYRVGTDGRVSVVADDFVRPNGLAFSADESRLYVVDTGQRHIRVFDVTPTGLRGGAVLAECTAGSFDGIRVDRDGRVWAAAHDGLHVLHGSTGDLLGKLLLPEVASNLCFGGPQLNQLFVTATRTLYSLRVNVNGVR